MKKEETYNRWSNKDKEALHRLYLDASKEEILEAIPNRSWQVKKQPRISPVDILTTRSDGTRRAFRVTVQGHLYNKDVTALREYGMDNEIDVLHICKAGLERLRFIRMYPRNIHKYNIKQ